MSKQINHEIIYVLQEIQTEIKEEFNEDYSIQELYEITHSQFTGSVTAFKKGVEVRLPFFGTFIRKFISEKQELIRKLKAYKEIATPEEYERKREAVNAYNIRKSAQRKKERNKKGLSFEEFEKLPFIRGKKENESI